MLTPNLSIVHINLPDPFFATTVPLSPSPSDLCQKHSVYVWRFTRFRSRRTSAAKDPQGSRVSKQVLSTPHLPFAGKMPLPVISNGISAPKGGTPALRKRSVG